MTNIKQIGFRYKFNNDYLCHYQNTPISHYKPLTEPCYSFDSNVVKHKTEHCKGVYTHLLTTNNEAFLSHSFIPCQICTVL